MLKSPNHWLIDVGLKLAVCARVQSDLRSKQLHFEATEWEKSLL